MKKGLWYWEIYAHFTRPQISQVIVYSIFPVKCTFEYFSELTYIVCRGIIHVQGNKEHFATTKLYTGALDCQTLQVT